MENQTFEDFLEQWFIDLNQVGGVPITKDNFEYAYDKWLSGKDTEEMIVYANLYGKSQYLAGQEIILKK